MIFINPYRLVTGGGGGSVPTVVGVSSVAAGTGAQIVPWVSGHQADDVALNFHVWRASNAAPSVDPTNSTIFLTSDGDNQSDNRGIQLSWSRATSGAMSDVTFEDAGPININAMIVLRGCTTTGNPFETITSGNHTPAGTSLSITGGTPSQNNSLLIFGNGWALDSNTDDLSVGFTNSNLSNVTNRFTSQTNSSSGGGLYVGTGEQATAAATGATTATFTTAAKGNWFKVAAIPA